MVYSRDSPRSTGCGEGWESPGMQGGSRTGRRAWIAAAIAIGSALAAAPADAYIGPGAGFAFVGSFLVLLTTFVLAFAIILTWPIRMLYRLVAVGNPYKNAHSKRVVVLGLRRLHPRPATKFMLHRPVPNS